MPRKTRQKITLHPFHQKNTWREFPYRATLDIVFFCYANELDAMFWRALARALCEQKKWKRFSA